jgi:hypothetical protein
MTDVPNQRWLYAGIYKGPNGVTDHIWFAFDRVDPRFSRDGWKIVFSGSNETTPLGNRNVGLGKRYLITWVKYLQRGWSGFLTSNGQWADGQAWAGRRAQRDHLLSLHKDPTFVDPFPKGCPKLYLGPRLNMIHPPGGVQEDPAVHRQRKLDAAECYPNSRIPLSNLGIKVDLFLEISKSAIEVVTDFLNGKMAFRTKHSLVDFHVLQADRVESAFFHLGWRVDWRAVYKANKHVREKYVKFAMNSRSWISHPPIQVDDKQRWSNTLTHMMPHMQNENKEFHGYDSAGSSADEDTRGHECGGEGDELPTFSKGARNSNNAKPKAAGKREKPKAQKKQQSSKNVSRGNHVLC